MGRIVMEDKLQCKQNEKKKLRKDITAVSIQLKFCINVLIYSVLLHKINIAVWSRLNVISKTHDKTLFTLCKQIVQPSLNENAKQCKNIMHNCSS